MDPWKEERVLILGKTYITQSVSHEEINCTGGILERTHEMVRLHPISWRHLDGSGRPRDFHWIRAQVRQHDKDGRPESLRINPTTITLDGAIPASSKEERRYWLQGCRHLVQSVEALQDLHLSTERSLGIVKPKKIVSCSVRQKASGDRAAWEEREAARQAQPYLDGRRPLPIDFVEVEFRVSWTCDDARCKHHDMGLLDFGIHQLWRKLAGDPKRAPKVRDKMEQMLDTERYDVYLFLGNVKKRPRQFLLVGSENLPKHEPTLYD